MEYLVGQKLAPGLVVASEATIMGFESIAKHGEELQAEVRRLSLQVRELECFKLLAEDRDRDAAAMTRLAESRGDELAAAKRQISALQEECQDLRNLKEQLIKEKFTEWEPTKRLNDHLRKIIERIEWRNYSPNGQHCPWCGWAKSQGHDEGCDLGHVLHGAFPPTSERPIHEIVCECDCDDVTLGSCRKVVEDGKVDWTALHCVDCCKQTSKWRKLDGKPTEKRFDVTDGKVEYPVPANMDDLETKKFTRERDCTCGMKTLMVGLHKPGCAVRG